ncbi:GGDEF domain-containing protein [Treponema sp.]|uniref:GGDEF domain-containing protein n=1 Tax=Treponema sp. TaxID=166 RepID=UPI0025EE86B3|nr:GGDEF domain-containing protein [Treponema sp.]MCR5219295.1 GGDEF domain-containing protein [Treponema sp.]
MDYVWIIEIDTFCCFILGIILYSLFKNYDRQTKQRYYIKALIMGVVSFLSEINWALLEGNIIREPRIINFFTNAVYYISSILMGYFWLNYVETALESKALKKSGYRIAANLPVLIVILGVIASYFNGFFFYIDENNVYHRGKFVIVHTVLCHSFTLVTSLHALKRSLETKVYLKQLEYKILSMFLLFPLTIGIIQIIFPEIPTVSIGISLAFLFVYIDLQNLLISVDTLTGLNNRNQLMKYLGNKIRNENENENLYVFMLDVNKFKKINDTYGHVEGDAALVRCAKALKTFKKDGQNFIGRYGGDEFIVIAEIKDKNSLESYCQKMKNELAYICKKEKVAYDLSFSIGYALYNKNMKSIQDFIAEADKKLYEAKKQRVVS